MMAEIRIAIPTFDGRLNKNTREMLSRILHGKSDGYNQVLDSFEMLIRANVNAKGIKFNPHPEDKLEVTLLVYRPNPSHDPQNYVDSMLDIIKKGIGVDDKYFRTTVDSVDPKGPDDKEFYPHFEIILKGE